MVTFSEDGSHFALSADGVGSRLIGHHFVTSHAFVSIFSIEKGDSEEYKISEILTFDDNEGMVRMTSEYIFYKETRDTLSVMDVRDALKLKEIDVGIQINNTNKIKASSILAGRYLLLFHGAIERRDEYRARVADGKYALHAVDLDTLETRHELKLNRIRIFELFIAQT